MDADELRAELDRQQAIATSAGHHHETCDAAMLESAKSGNGSCILSGDWHYPIEMAKDIKDSLQQRGFDVEDVWLPGLSVGLFVRWWDEALTQ